MVDKKILIFGMLILLVVFLASCTNTPENEVSVEPPVTAVEVPETFVETTPVELPVTAVEENPVGEPLVYEITSLELPICESAEVDELGLGAEIQAELDDRDYCALKDSSFSFNGDEFSYQELIVIEGARIVYSGDDSYDGLGNNVALALETSKAVSYRFVINSNDLDELDFEDVSAEDPLEIDFLGKHLRIVSVDGDEIRVENGQSLMMRPNQVFGDLVLNVIGEDEVAVSYAGKPYVLSEGDVKYLGDGKRLRLTSAFEGAEMATFILSDGSSKLYSDGEAYLGQDSDDPVWDWIIDAENGVFGVEYHESLTDEDEVLQLGETLVFPENFVQLSLAKLSDDETNDASFDFSIEDINGVATSVLRLEGKFEYTGDNANELVWDGIRFYAKEEGDWVEVQNPAFEINSHRLLTFNPDVLGFDNIVLAVDFGNESWLEIQYDDRSIVNEDDTLTAQGYLIRDPENAYNDGHNGKQLEITGIPEEEPEYGLIFSSVEA